MQPIPGLKGTLGSPEGATPYSGMLPGLVAGHYARDDVYIDLVPLCQYAGVDFLRGQVSGLDPIEQTIEISGRPALRYDLLSIDVGSTPAAAELTGDAIIPVKPISLFPSIGRGLLKTPLEETSVILHSLEPALVASNCALRSTIF